MKEKEVWLVKKCSLVPHLLLKDFLWRSAETDLSSLQVETAGLNYWKVLEHITEFLV